MFERVHDRKSSLHAIQPHFHQPLWLQTPLAPAQCIALTHPAYVDSCPSGA